MTNRNCVTQKLFELQDEAYGQFQARLLPSVPKDAVIGVRTPLLRAYARELMTTCGAEGILSGRALDGFWLALPHTYFEENQLRAFIISELKDFDTCLTELETFLPFVDNWATCDQMSPKCFKKNRDLLLPCAKRWTEADPGKVYTIRFGIKVFMDHFLGENFCQEYAERVAGLRSEAYYVNMMRAWYFATALAKNYEETIPYLEQHRLDAWTHQKAIQKAVESYRLSAEAKVYLRTLKHSKT